MTTLAENIKAVQEVMQTQEKEISDLMGEFAEVPTTPSQFPPRLLELVRILQENPILVPPALEFVRLRQAQVADATGQVLYGADRWEEMKEEARKA